MSVREKDFGGLIRSAGNCFAHWLDFFGPHLGAVAQLARATHLQCVGRRFEPDQLHHVVDTTWLVQRSFVVREIDICNQTYGNMSCYLLVCINARYRLTQK